MSEMDTEQASAPIEAEPASQETLVEQSGVSQELADAGGDQYAHIIKEIAEEEAAEAAQVTEAPSEEEETQQLVEESNNAEDDTEQQDESTEEVSNDLYALNVKGSTKDVDRETVIALAQKGLRFTEKSQENAESIKRGIQLELAQSGDASAQRAVIESMLKGANKDNIDDLIDSLAGVDAKLDTTALETKYQFDADTKSAFADIGGADTPEVRQSVSIIQSDLKNSWPEDLYDQIVSDPYNVRHIHNSIQDGSFQKTAIEVEVQLAQLNPSEERMARNNSEMFQKIYDAAYDKVTLTGSSNQSGNSPSEQGTESTEGNPLNSLNEGPPLSLSGKQRKAPVAYGDDVDFENNDEAYNALLNKIDKQSKGF